MTSLINAKLLANSAKRYWPLWAAVLAAWALGLLMPVAVLAPNVQALYDVPREALQTGWAAEHVAALLGSVVAAATAALCMFDHAFDKKAAIFFGSAPLRRNTLFVTQFLAGLLPLVAVELVVFAVLAGMSVAYEAVSIEDCATWLELALCFTLVFYVTAVLCVQVSGTRGMALVLYALSLGLLPSLEAVMTMVADSLVWGAVLSFEGMFWCLTPVGVLADHVLPGYENGSVNHLAVLAVTLVSVAAAVLAGLLHKRRDLEAAGMPLTSTRLVPLFKALVALLVVTCFGFVGFLMAQFDAGSSSSESDALLMGGMLVAGSVVGAVFAQGLVTRSSRCLSAAWKLAAVLSLASVVFVGGCCLDVLGIERKVPAADQIASVELQDESVLTSEEGIARATELHRRVLAVGPVEGAEATADPDDLYYPGIDLTFEYTLKDGSVISRSYSYAEGLLETDAVTQEVRWLANQYERLERSIEARLSLSQPYLEASSSDVIVHLSVVPAMSKDAEGGATTMDLSTKETAQFVKALEKDVREHGAYVGWASWHYSEDEPLLQTSVEMETKGANNARSFQLSSKNTPNCIAWIEKNLGYAIS